MVESAQTRKTDVLKGIDAIARFSDRTYRTLIRLKQQFPGMPMNKDSVDGIWWADPDRLNQFLKDVAAGQGDKWQAPPATTKQTPKPKQEPTDGEESEPEPEPDSAPQPSGKNAGKGGK